MAEFTIPLTTDTHPVTLNLFQGLSGHKLSSCRLGGMVASSRAARRFGCGAKWTLKQVQGDRVGYGFA